MSTAQPATPSYFFADTDEPRRGGTSHKQLLQILPQIMDPYSRSRLEPLITDQSVCWEIGAGAGDIAVWLADRAALVWATDIDPRHIPTDHPRLRVVKADIVTDPYPGEQPPQVVRARLLLGHIPAHRQAVLQKIYNTLTPGGWLVVEEFIPAWDRCLMHSFAPRARALFTTYHQALTGAMRMAGSDPDWHQNCYDAITETGFINIGGKVFADLWHGGEPGCLLPYHVAGHKRHQLMQAGMPEGDIDAFRAILLDPTTVIYANLCLSLVAQKPA